MLMLVGLAGLVAFVVASFVVGGRILGLARQTRGLPETLIGLSLLSAGGVGTGLSVLPLLWPAMSTSTSYLVSQAASVANHIGYALLLVFVWRVFRPAARWAAVLFFVSFAALAVGGIGMAITLLPGDSISRPTGAAYSWLMVSLAMRLLGYGWASIESFRYYTMLRRRVKIGLADPRTAGRFYYWGVCTSAVSVIWLNMGAEQLIPGYAAFSGFSQLISAMLSFVVAWSLSMAFFPPTKPDTEEASAPSLGGEHSRG